MEGPTSRSYFFVLAGTSHGRWGVFVLHYLVAVGSHGKVGLEIGATSTITTTTILLQCPSDLGCRENTLRRDNNCSFLLQWCSNLIIKKKEW
jgi:hypothetical protein